MIVGKIMDLQDIKDDFENKLDEDAIRFRKAYASRCNNVKEMSYSQKQLPDNRQTVEYGHEN